MTKDQKNEVIELLKGKFSQYNNFYVADTESLTVAQIGKLRHACYNKKVEMKVAKNTLIKKAMESLDAERYSGMFDALHNVTALMFSENPKDPALIISTFRKESNGERPVLKAAFINGEVYMGDNQLVALTKLKTRNELIGELIGLLQSPVKRVIAALLHHHEPKAAAVESPAVEPEKVAIAEATLETKSIAVETPVEAATEVSTTEVSTTETAASEPANDTEVKSADDETAKPAEE